MTENEVIVVDSIPQATYDSLIRECVEYSIISLPFTVDRMSIPDDKRRALNIAKGKIAEHLFKYFCDANDIYPDFDICSTPFWTVDNRDFMLNGHEWDIKNNFYYAPISGLSYNYTDLPALVPNRFSGDQWSKRNINMLSGSDGVSFLFTFLKGADLNSSGDRGNEFLEIVLNQSQLSYIHQLYSKYQGQPQSRQPFTEEEFWSEISNRGSMELFRLNARPALIITGYANNSNWDIFRDTGKYDRNNNWVSYYSPSWYRKVGMKGSLTFLNGTLWTTITNATVPVKELPSFLSLYPHLKNGIKYGHWG